LLVLVALEAPQVSFWEQSDTDLVLRDAAHNTRSFACHVDRQF